VVVVEDLKAVEVEHDDGKRLVAAVGARCLAQQLLVPGPPVRQAGELVCARHAREPLAQLGVLGLEPLELRIVEVRPGASSRRRRSALVGRTSAKPAASALGSVLA